MQSPVRGDVLRALATTACSRRPASRAFSSFYVLARLIAMTEIVVALTAIYQSVFSTVNSFQSDAA
jgi:hypothetical protein